MSDFSLKSFNDAFASASKKGGALTAGHQQQLDKLQEVVDAINAEGTFKAELGKWVNEAAALKITHKDDTDALSFRIGFGFEAFSGSPTIALTYSAARTPVGKPEGYALQFDGDKLLKELGETVARLRNQAKLDAAALKYATKKTGATP